MPNVNFYSVLFIHFELYIFQFFKVKISFLQLADCPQIALKECLNLLKVQKQDYYNHLNLCSLRVVQAYQAIFAYFLHQSSACLFQMLSCVIDKGHLFLEKWFIFEASNFYLFFKRIITVPVQGVKKKTAP